MKILILICVLSCSAVCQIANPSDKAQSKLEQFTEQPGALVEKQFAASQDKLIFCPLKLDASYGGTDGWSATGVQAKFSKAVAPSGQYMICHYGYGASPVAQVFNISRPCPNGYKCEALGTSNMFKLTPLRKQ